MDITQIKETCLYVKDLEASKDFYHGKLGFKIVSEVEGSHIFFRAGSSVLLCFIPEVSKNKQSPPPHFAYGNQHIAFEVGQDQYIKWREEILNLGIEIIQDQQWKNHLQSFYFRDPDNHVLEIIPTGVWD